MVKTDTVPAEGRKNPPERYREDIVHCGMIVAKIYETGGF